MIYRKKMTWRKIHLNDIEYKYRIGRTTVVIKSPEGKSKFVSFSELMGMKWSDIEKGIWKKWFSIKPNNIVEYLKNNNIFKEEENGKEQKRNKKRKKYSKEKSLYRN